MVALDCADAERRSVDVVVALDATELDDIVLELTVVYEVAVRNSGEVSFKRRSQSSIKPGIKSDC